MNRGTGKPEKDNFMQREAGMTARRTGPEAAIFIFILVLGLTALAGCAKPRTGQIDPDSADQGDMVAAVKQGTLALDTGITVGDAFDHYGGFIVKWNEWERFQTQNRRNIVEFRGHLDLRQADMSDADIDRIEKALLVVQFSPKVDGGLEIRYMGYVLKAHGGPEKEYSISKGKQDHYLKAIYGNYKFSNSRYEFIIESLVLN